VVASARAQPEKADIVTAGTGRAVRALVHPARPRKVRKLMSVARAAETGGEFASAGGIRARIERLPLSWWQIRTRIIVGTATFFDAFDALTIAYVLPVIVPLWKLNPGSIGTLISAGYLG